MTTLNKNKFIDMAFALEPEMLSADGENSREVQDKIANEIINNWNNLQNQLQETVTIEQAFQWEKEMREAQ